jgi:Mrp family chromosome partitioning ATPase
MIEESIPGTPVRDATWFTRRSRNALRRPLLIAVVGGLVFVLTLIGLLVIPRRGDNSAKRIAALASERRDTTELMTSQARARAGLAAAEEALADARRRALRPTPAPPPDTLPPQLIARRDSLRRASAALNTMIERVENAPLPASYRALGEMRELGAEPRIRALLDSLQVIEREREEFGAVGGVDPIFVALTARATAIGRAIQGIAEARRTAAQEELVRLRPPPPPAPVIVALVDTAPIVVRRDAAVTLLDSSTRLLAEIRQANADIDRRVEAEREAANVEIPPLTLLAAALVLAGVIGFGVALLVEMRRSRIADPEEAEEMTGLRVLAVVLPKTTQPERTRRRADQDISPLLDPTSNAYRLLYLHVAGYVPRLSLITVSGDDPVIAATVAANLAAAATYDARSTLLIDAELSSCAVSSILGIRAEPGFGDILTGRADWTEAVIPATIGRDRALDVIPSGLCEEPAEGFDPEPARHSLARTARRYDLVVLVAASRMVQQADRSILPAPDLIYCARLGETSIASLQAATKALREAGARITGLVLWNAEVPLVQSRELLAARSAAMETAPLSAGRADR